MAAPSTDGDGSVLIARGGSSLNPVDVRAALDELKAFRAKLVRECSMGYCCPLKLREEANTLLSSITGTIAAPTEGQKVRMREVKDETAQVVNELNRIVETTIKKLNDSMSSQPHIVTGAPIK